MKLTRGQLKRLIQESMRIPGLDRVFDQIDADPVDNQPLPMAGARETFSQDTGLFGSNVDRPDDMRDMSVQDEDRIFRQVSKMEEARYALVYFRAYITGLENYLKIHAAGSPDWNEWKRAPGSMAAVYYVQEKLRKVYMAMTDAVDRHGNPEKHSPKRFKIVIDNVEKLREAAESGKLDANETIRLEGYANAYIAVNDMVFVGHNHHLMTVQTAAETLGDRELVSRMIDFEGFNEDVNDGKVLELFDFFDRFNPERQSFMY